MNTKVVFDTDGNYTVETEGTMKKESDLKDNLIENSKSNEAKRISPQKQTKQNSKRKTRKPAEKQLEKTNDKQSEDTKKAPSVEENKKQLNKMLEDDIATNKSVASEDTGSTVESPVAQNIVEPENTEESNEKSVKIDAIKEDLPDKDLDNITFLSVTEFLQSSILEEGWFISQIISKLHVFICTPATAHYIGNDLVIYGAIKLSDNTVILHCMSLKTNNHTVFIYYSDRNAIEDTAFNITENGILKVNENMICSLRAKPNGI